MTLKVSSYSRNKTTWRMWEFLQLYILYKIYTMIINVVCTVDVLQQNISDPSNPRLEWSNAVFNCSTRIVVVRANGHDSDHTVTAGMMWGWKWEASTCHNIPLCHIAMRPQGHVREQLEPKMESQNAQWRSRSCPPWATSRHAEYFRSS